MIKKLEEPEPPEIPHFTSEVPEEVRTAELPNSTPEIDEALLKRLNVLAGRYIGAGKKSVAQIFELADVIVQAHYEFGEGILREFYNLIRVDPKGPTSKKYRRIGEKKVRFQPFLGMLPNCWTTIYELAKVADDRFQRLVDSDLLHPGVTWKELRPHCTDEKKEIAEQPQRVVFDLRKIAMMNRGAFAKQVRSLVDQYNVSLPKEQRATLDSFIASEKVDSDE